MEQVGMARPLTPLLVRATRCLVLDTPCLVLGPRVPNLVSPSRHLALVPLTLSRFRTSRAMLLVIRPLVRDIVPLSLPRPLVTRPDVRVRPLVPS